jgi:hypothetical protein
MQRKRSAIEHTNFDGLRPFLASWLGGVPTEEPMNHEAFDEKLNDSESPVPIFSVLVTSVSLIGFSLFLVELVL